MLGRFLSPDPIVPEPGNPQALNRYSYVYNNPYKYTDPSGHCPAFGLICGTVIAALVVGTPVAVWVAPYVPVLVDMYAGDFRNLFGSGRSTTERAISGAGLAFAALDFTPVGRAARLASLLEVAGDIRGVDVLEMAVRGERLGADWHAERAIYWAKEGGLEAIEEALEFAGGKTGRIDLLLKDGTYVDAKDWVDWARNPEFLKRKRFRELKDQLTKYLSHGRKLLLEFRDEIPDEVWRWLLDNYGDQLRDGLLVVKAIES